MTTSPPNPEDAPGAQSVGPPPGPEPSGQPTASTSSAAEHRSRTVPLVRLVRTVWLATVAVVLAVVFFSTAPLDDAGDDSLSWTADIESAQSIRDLNEETVSGAPQQAVANGWHTADLLELQVTQATELAEDSRELARAQTDGLASIAALVLILGFGILGDMALRLWDTSARRPRPGYSEA